jgi:hypothetical protein
LTCIAGTIPEIVTEMRASDGMINANRILEFSRGRDFSAFKCDGGRTFLKELADGYGGVDDTTPNRTKFPW